MIKKQTPLEDYIKFNLMEKNKTRILTILFKIYKYSEDLFL
jgi:hypothetical protein